MQTAYIVTGTLTDKQTVTLDEAIPLNTGRVRLVIEAESEIPPVQDDIMDRIWERQRQRGHKPPTREEVDAYLKAERDSWDD